MSKELRPVSEIYQPTNNAHHIQDESKNEVWRYTIGYECNKSDQPVPEGGNTAIFRVAPKGLTEPVFVTKPEGEATFTVTVLDGKGVFVRARADGTVDEIPLETGSQVVVLPGEAYSYANTGETDLLLHDVALPAFRPGDEADITSSLIPSKKANPGDDYAACITNKRLIELPIAFFDAMSEVMK